MHEGEARVPHHQRRDQIQDVVRRYFVVRFRRTRRLTVVFLENHIVNQHRQMKFEGKKTTVYRRNEALNTNTNIRVLRTLRL